MKAYTVIWNSTQRGTEFAASERGKVTYAAYRFIREYVTQDVCLNQFRTVRAPEYDDMAASKRDGQSIFSRDLSHIAYDLCMPEVGYTW